LLNLPILSKISCDSLIESRIFEQPIMLHRVALLALCLLASCITHASSYSYPTVCDPSAAEGCGSFRIQECKVLNVAGAGIPVANGNYTVAPYGSEPQERDPHGQYPIFCKSPACTERISYTVQAVSFQGLGIILDLPTSDCTVLGVLNGNHHRYLYENVNPVTEPNALNFDIKTWGVRSGSGTSCPDGIGRPLAVGALPTVRCVEFHPSTEMLVAQLSDTLLTELLAVRDELKGEINDLRAQIDDQWNATFTCQTATSQSAVARWCTLRNIV